jgi:predicted aldo/keto reductase-like oxidoreductase
LTTTSQLVRDYKNVIKDEGDSARCVACGQCEAACPQQLEIIKLLDKIHQEATK